MSDTHTLFRSRDYMPMSSVTSISRLALEKELVQLRAQNKSLREERRILKMQVANFQLEAQGRKKTRQQTVKQVKNKQMLKQREQYTEAMSRKAKNHA